MNRLLAFGCSHTYGESLPDCLTTKSLDAPMPPPSQFAWPNLLAKKLDMECVNLGSCGASNKQIHYNIVNTNFEKDNVVFVLWTHHSRSCFLQDEPIDEKGLQFKQLTPGYIKKFKQNPRWRRLYNYRYYELFHTEENSRYETQLSIDHSYNYLLKKGIKNFHFTFERKGIRPITSKFTKEMDAWVSAPIQNLDLLEDTGADRLHPGVSAHVDLAENIFARIEEQI